MLVVRQILIANVNTETEFMLDCQMEELNEGGLLFLQRQPNLRMRLCHGNTLTAGVILNGLPADVHEIFLTGATSKLGRAVSIYLATHGVRVLVRTSGNYKAAHHQSCSFLHAEVLSSQHGT